MSEHVLLSHPPLRLSPLFSLTIPSLSRRDTPTPSYASHRSRGRRCHRGAHHPRRPRTSLTDLVHQHRTIPRGTGSGTRPPPLTGGERPSKRFTPRTSQQTKGGSPRRTDPRVGGGGPVRNGGTAEYVCPTPFRPAARR